MLSSHNRKASLSARQGFTLIEVVAALAVFTIIMMAVIQIFGTGFKAYRQTRELQRTLESAQFATNIMAKELRTSSIVGSFSDGVSTRVAFFDYSQNRCIGYNLNAAGNGGLLKYAHGFALSSPDLNFAACSAYAVANAWTAADRVGFLVSRGITGSSISIVRSTPIASAGSIVGKVTFSITFGWTSRPATLQTTVSLRDFNYVGL